MNAALKGIAYSASHSLFRFLPVETFPPLYLIRSTGWEKMRIEIFFFEIREPFVFVYVIHKNNN